MSSRCIYFNLALQILSSRHSQSPISYQPSKFPSFTTHYVILVPHAHNPTDAAHIHVSIVLDNQLAKPFANRVIKSFNIIIVDTLL